MSFALGFTAALALPAVMFALRLARLAPFIAAAVRKANAENREVRAEAAKAAHAAKELLH